MLIHMLIHHSCVATAAFDLSFPMQLDHAFADPSPEARLRQLI